LGELTWLGHSTVLIDVAGTRVVTDPVLRARIFHLRRTAAVGAEAAGRVDGILVSHGHFDHLDLATLRRLDRAATVVVPRGLGGLVRRRRFRRVVEVEPGDEVELGSVRVRATHAEHEGSRGPHRRGTPSLGFVVSGPTSVYFAGDTDLFDGMSDIGPVDVALLPVAGWGPRLPPGHLDPERAAEAARRVRPRIAVPIHWGTYSTRGTPPPAEDPAQAFAAAARRLAPAVDVRVLAIGETLALEAVA
jgi:L-ascorbate metabolism protein UlaG (beta-lactamase superfamily)